MTAGQRVLAAALVAVPCVARADLPCDGWVEHGDTLERHGPHGDLVLRAAPEALAALRRTLLFRCDGNQGPRPALDIGAVEVEGALHRHEAAGGAAIELRLHLRAQRLQFEAR